MGCNCTSKDKHSIIFCKDCLPNINDWLVPVEKVPDVFFMDRNHAYIDKDDYVYILDYTRKSYVRFGGHEAEEVRRLIYLATSFYPDYDRAVAFDSLQSFVDKSKEWSDGYLEFLKHNTTDTAPLAINSLGLIGGSFVIDDPIKTYTPPTTGTSEAQLLVLRGLLKQYIATNDEKWKTLAEKVTEALFKYYYPSPEIPLEADAGWVPHWLVNVTAPFTSREYFTDGKATFVNGVATVTYNKVFRVYSARALDAKLEYEWSPTAPVVGKEYEIEGTVVSYGQSKAVITLKDKTFNGELLVVYSSETGRVINVGEKCEAFPIWRPLENGEIACAVDTLPWALDCYLLWYEITKDEKWQLAIDSTKKAIVEVSDVSNTIYYLTPKEEGTPVLANGVTNYSERVPKETYTNSSGVILIDYPSVSEKAEGSFGTWVGDHVSFNSKSRIEASLWSNKQAKLTLKIDEERQYSAEKRWRCDFFTSTKGESFTEKYMFNPSDFYRDDFIYWGAHYGRDANSSAVASGNSKVSDTQKIVGRTKVTEFNFTRGDEGGWLGWAQSVLGLWGVSLPVDIKYKTDSRVYFRVNDSEGTNWSYELPKTNGEFKTVSLTEDLLTKGGAFAKGAYQSVLLEAIDEVASIQVEYIGRLIPFDKDFFTTINFSYSEVDSLRVGIEYIKPFPSRNPLPYAPYLMPFDMHYINYSLSDLRGAIYTGYQAPWIYQEGIFPNSNEALTTNLTFLRESQDAYASLTEVDGFFAPIFWWDYMGDASGHESNTFGITGNWGEVWGGFQYRTISDVARVFVKDPSNILAHKITIRFFEGVKKYWKDTLTGFPTVFVEGTPPYNNQRDAHMVTNLARALVYSLKSTLITTSEKELIQLLLEKCVNYINYNYINVEGFSSSRVEGTWSPDKEAETWYEYWGGDILDTLGIFQIEDLSSVSSSFSYEEGIEKNRTTKFSLNDSFDLKKGDKIVYDSSDSKWKIFRAFNNSYEKLSLSDQDKMTYYSTQVGMEYLYVITDEALTLVDKI